jgi:7-cyano-7-deazaguanine reductase
MSMENDAPPVTTGALETFPNQFPERDYTIEIRCPEFTSVCPKTGQPDFGVVTYVYVPDKTCVELKSLKLYLQGFRNRGIFYENVVNTLMSEFVAACQPRKACIIGDFSPRGGITTKVTVCHPSGTGLPPWQ